MTLEAFQECFQSTWDRLLFYSLLIENGEIAFLVLESSV